MSEPHPGPSPGPSGAARPDPSRRDFLATAAASAACLGCLGHAMAWARSLSPRVRYEPPTRRKLGPPTRFPAGVTFLVDERVFILKDDAGVRALSAVCTHLGCTVQRESGESAGFHCPCHGSRFGPDGKNVSGPAPRPLPWRPLSLAGDGSMVVDLAAETGPDIVVKAGDDK
jgi:cytochrome b6-f complex iron-sulfur subunit